MPSGSFANAISHNEHSRDIMCHTMLKGNEGIDRIVVVLFETHDIMSTYIEVYNQFKVQVKAGTNPSLSLFFKTITLLKLWSKIDLNNSEF